MSFERIGKKETLSEKVCTSIKESILKGELKGGESIPTEPELEKQFGVSRMVIRDAVRMLKAQGLIDIIQGKGMYVTQNSISSFSDALLTFLRRGNATVWDIEQFEHIFFPQVFAVASREASPSEKEDVKSKGMAYLNAFETWENSKKLDSTQKAHLLDKAKDAFDKFILSLFDCTHNQMITLIGQVLHSLRKWRNIPDSDNISLHPYEESMIQKMLLALDQKDPQKASDMIAKNIHFDREIIQVFKDTPIGTSPDIPAEIFYSAFLKD